MEENTKFCPLCGGTIPSDAESCTFCGADLSNSNTEPEKTIESVETAQPSAENIAPSIDTEAIPLDFPNAAEETKDAAGTIPAYVPKPVDRSSSFDLPDPPKDVNVPVDGAKGSTNNSGKVWLWIAIAVVAIIGLCICCFAALIVFGLASN